MLFEQAYRRHLSRF